MRKILFFAILVLVSSCFAIDIDIVEYIAYSTCERAAIAHDNYVYISIYHGFEIWDYTNPVNPVKLDVIGNYHNDGNTNYNYLEIIDNQLYGIGLQHIDIYELTDPSNPEYLYSIDLQGELSEAIIEKIVVYGNELIVGASWGFHTIYENDPSEHFTMFLDMSYFPEVLQTRDPLGYHISPIVHDDYLYFIDLTEDWTYPYFEGNIYIRKYFLNEETNELVEYDFLPIYVLWSVIPKIYINEETLYYHTDMSFSSVSITEEMNILSSVDLPEPDFMYDHAFFEECFISTPGYRIDISNPEELIYLGFVDGGNNFSGCVYHREDILVIDNYIKFFTPLCYNWTFEFNETDSLSLVSTDTAREIASSTIIDDNLLVYINNRPLIGGRERESFSSIEVYDIADLSEVQFLRELIMPSNCVESCWINSWKDYVLLRPLYQQSLILRYSENDILDVVGELEHQITEVMLKNEDNLLYYAYSANSIIILEEHDNLPVVVHQINMEETFGTTKPLRKIIEYDDDYLIMLIKGLTAGNDCILLGQINEDNSINYQLEIVSNDLARYYDMEIYEGYLYYSYYVESNEIGNRSFIGIVDMTDLQNPIVINDVQVESPPMSMKVIGNHLFGGDHTVYVYDVSNPVDLQLVYQSDIETTNFKNVYVDGDYFLTLNNFVCVKELTGLSEIVEDSIILNSRLTSYNHPNPFNPSTTLSFELENFSENVQVSVYNIKGQKVWEKQANDYDIGKHEFIWNGKDSHGIDMPSGVYLYQIQTDDEYVSSKMILLK